ncbi:MAG TPA: AAA family ATPase [Pseudobacteroides sp.]|nr:AAA family ATPase [Pseudobacteroides sp.]
MQRIIIENFGPIKSCNIEIKDFMILIGNQATGKSTICKCIYFFKSLRDNVKEYLYEVLNNGITAEQQFIDVINKELKNKFVNLFGLSKYKSKFNIEYHFDNEINASMTITDDNKKYLHFILSPLLIKKIKDLETKALEYHKELHALSQSNTDDLYYKLEKQKFFITLSKEVDYLFKDERKNYYIPAGRSLITLLTKQLLTIELKNLDYITKDFINLIESEKGNFDVSLKELVENIEMLRENKTEQKRKEIASTVTSLLKGEYYRRNGNEYLKLRNGNTIPINYTSSGQQEMLWMLNLLFLWMLKEKKAFVIIEEPEAHLFPDTQKGIIDFIAMFFNSNDNQVLISTHSPYTLTAVNNLIYAHKVGLKNRNTSNIIPESLWLNINRVGAIMLSDGELHSIIDTEINEIAAEEIDKISQKISKDYADIYNLEVESEDVNS